MLKIDKAILTTSDMICRNISSFNEVNRGLLSQNILSNLRNFVEYIAKKIYAQGEDISPHTDELRKEAIRYIKVHGEFRDIYEFHTLLQKSTSHYTMTEDASERLMLKYYEYLLKIKSFLQDNYNLEVLKNISDFPLNTDSTLLEYYEKIANKLNNTTSNFKTNNGCYYVHRVRPFFVDGHVYYEITISTATDNASKFERLIAFTKHKIFDNYSVSLSIHKDVINILDKNMPIYVIDNWKVHIRICELKNFAKIFNEKLIINSKEYEYIQIMNFLTDMRMPLSEFVDLPDSLYTKLRNQILGNTNYNIYFMKILDKCHTLVKNNSAGSNVIRYLLYVMNNKIIKAQLADEPCRTLSNLYLSYGCVPFDRMPFCSSLKKHNPSLYSISNCIESINRTHELFARFIRNNSEIEGKLFTSIKDILNFNDIDKLVEEYNGTLYSGHKNRRLEYFNGYVYLKEYVDNALFIIKKLQELSLSGLNNYANYVESQMDQEHYGIDSEEKLYILKKLFISSRVALIYGSAGTGKSTIMSYIARLFTNQSKIFLANTHAAIENLKRKIYVRKSQFFTIARFISNNNEDVTSDLLFIDECSTVSNADMRKIIEKAVFKVLILVGDIYQIESIYFGNWFYFAPQFVKESTFELQEPHRTQNEKLLILWERVRKIENSILEIMVKEDYSTKLDESVFTNIEKDEIILCLNYDGLYGINNINRFLQSNNPNTPIQWGINTYKIGDPILFNESERFTPIIHNNTKGWIVNIQLTSNKIWFDIELDFPINEIETAMNDFEIIGVSDNGNSIIRFDVGILSDVEDDAYNSKSVMPFQVSYAISIHKAQGLEYHSVKIIITDEVEEQITHNIFYTAITRTKEHLKIYWSPETENKILSRFKNKDLGLDLNFLRQLIATKSQ